VDFRLELVTVPVADVDRAKACYVDQVGFGVEQDVQARSCGRRGVTVTDVQDFPWGRFCFFSDPDGNRWSVHEPPP
jgi:catechol 2,3-dioxygenase-like lactoylglutathione lyase family enzyme